MFDAFVKVSAPMVFACLLMLILVPDLFKLIPIAIGIGVVWSTFNVAKGFALGDVRREREDW
jgi:hypothetical protein